MTPSEAIATAQARGFAIAAPVPCGGGLYLLRVWSEGQEGEGYFEVDEDAGRGFETERQRALAAAVELLVSRLEDRSPRRSR
jgi:hypothetical protein